jgi:flagellar basal-body rod protein FlgB
MLNFLDAPHLRNMRMGLDLTWKRMEVTGHNIANINTPHYKAQKLEFENLLLAKINESRPRLYAHEMRYTSEQLHERRMRELAAIRPGIYTDEVTETRIDGNNVDIDFEFLQLSKQRIHYDYLVQRIAGAYSSLRHAISEGRA